VPWNLLEEFSTGVDLLFQWNLPLGSTRLGGLVVACASANRATDSNALGGLDRSCACVGLMWWKSTEFHGAAWRAIHSNMTDLEGLSDLPATAVNADVALDLHSRFGLICGPWRSIRILHVIGLFLC